MRYSAILCLAVILLFPTLSSARPLRNCLKTGTGKIVVKRRCKAKKGEQEVNAELLQGLGATQVGPPGPQGEKGDPGVQGSRGDKGDQGDVSILCSGWVNSNGGIGTFGGSATNVVSTSQAGTGQYSVSCSGDYPGVSGSGHISVLLTSQVSTSVLGFLISNASSTSVEFDVVIRRSDDLTLRNTSFTFLVVESSFSN